MILVFRYFLLDQVVLWVQGYPVHQVVQSIQLIPQVQFVPTRVRGMQRHSSVFPTYLLNTHWRARRSRRSNNTSISLEKT